MSTRGDLRDAIVTKIQGLSLVKGTTVGPFRGDENLANEAAEYPRIEVRLAQVLFGPNLAIGGTVYERDFYFDVHVYTESLAGGADGETTAFTLLDTLEAGLPGTLGATGRRVEIVDEEGLEAVELGRYRFRQRYLVRHTQP